MRVFVQVLNNAGSIMKAYCRLPLIATPSRDGGFPTYYRVHFTEDMRNSGSIAGTKSKTALEHHIK